MNIEFTAINDDGEQVELPRPESKSLDDVLLVASLHANNPAMHSVIDRFIEMFETGIQWDWFYRYAAWLERKANYVEVDESINPDTEDVIAAIKFDELEPVRPESKSAQQWREELVIDGVSINEYLFRLSRAHAVKNILVEIDGMIFNGDEDSQRRMLSAIKAGEDIGMNETMWRLSDNSQKAVTLKQLRLAHAASIIQQGELWIRK